MIETSEPVNYDALDALRSVLGADFDGLIAEFRQQTADSLVNLELALMRNNRSRIKTILHKLKGSSLSLHCTVLTNYCVAFEQGALAMDSDQVKESIEQLREIIVDTLLAIEVWVD